MTVSWALILPVGQESSPERRYLSGPEGKVVFLGHEQVVGKSLYPEEAWKDVLRERLALSLGYQGQGGRVARTCCTTGHHMILGFKT